MTRRPSSQLVPSAAALAVVRALARLHAKSDHEAELARLAGQGAKPMLEAQRAANAGAQTAALR
jgi:hypothetical protein